jgi:hypothetical protein
MVWKSKQLIKLIEKCNLLTKMESKFVEPNLNTKISNIAFMIFSPFYSFDVVCSMKKKILY